MSERRGRRPRGGDPKVAIAYLRTSTGEQQYGPEAQREQIELWARREGVQVVAWHKEHVSGGASLEKRRGLLVAIGDLVVLGAGVLVAMSRCRLARDVFVAGTIERLVADQGAVVRTTDAPFVQGAEARLFRHWVDGLAEYFLIIGRIRTRQALGVRRRGGLRISGLPPLGWRHGEGGRLEAVGHEQGAVRRIAELRAQGEPIAEIVRTLNGEGWPARGSRWHRSSVVRVIQRSVLE